MKSVKITAAVIKRIEQAAMLRLSEHERGQVGDDLELLLTYFDRLQELDSAGTLPLPAPLQGESVFREDRVIDQGLAGELRKNAPAGLDGWYLVPAAISIKQPDGGE